MARPTQPIVLSSEQKKHLELIVRSREVPHGLVQRATMVLKIHEGLTNKAIAQALQMREDTVGKWRQRWLGGCARLALLEDKPRRLREAIGELLADLPRPGCPPTFTAEQVTQILALACEKPPEHLTHWNQSDLVREAVQRGIVERISTTSIGRFLKSGGSQAASQPLLAEP